MLNGVIKQGTLKSQGLLASKSRMTKKELTRLQLRHTTKKRHRHVVLNVFLITFLYTGTMFAIFHSCGKTPRLSEVLCSAHKDVEISGTVSLSTHVEISTGPVAFVTSRFARTDSTSVTDRVILYKVAVAGFKLDASAEGLTSLKTDVK